MTPLLCAALLALSFPGVSLLLSPNQPEPRYEMTTYYVGLLMRGPKWTPEVTDETKRIQAGHMANIRKMAEAGKLVVAGPFSDNTNLRGMFIFKADSADEVKKLVDADPAVQSGRLVMELHPWYAGKGLSVAPPVRK